jgi:hypothetical protein
MNRVIYTIDLRKLRDEHLFEERIEFAPDAIAALEIPEQLPTVLSFLVWGAVILRPDLHIGLLDLLSESAKISSPRLLYHSGWSVLTFQGLTAAEFEVFPRSPTLSSSYSQPLYGKDGKAVCLTKKLRSAQWPLGTEYQFAFLLEQPYSLMSLVMTLTGSITLDFDPKECITVEQLRREPNVHGPDTTRTRQLQELQHRMKSEPHICG